MASIAWSDVIANCPADAAYLTAFPPAAQAAILAHVNTALDVSLFALGEADPRLFLARIYLAAHFATSGAFGAAGAAGPILNGQAGSIDAQFANIISVSDSQYNTTAYGRSYRALIRPLGGGFAVSAGGPIVVPGSGFGC